MKHADSIKLARKAFAAYEHAIAAAEEVRKLGPPRDLGTCIMTACGRYQMEQHECSECGHKTREKDGCKFCPHCGAEVIRFDHAPEPEAVKVMVTVTPEESSRQVHHENKLACEFVSPRLTTSKKAQV